MMVRNKTAVPTPMASSKLKGCSSRVPVAFAVRPTSHVLVLWIACVMSWASWVLCVGGVSAADTPGLAVSVSHSRVSVKARAVPTRQILERISRESGVAILIETGVDAEVGRDQTTIEIDDATIEEALRRLLRDRNVVFVYQTTALVEVRVYPDGSQTGTLARVGERREPSASRAPPARNTANAAPGPRRPKEIPQPPPTASSTSTADDDEEEATAVRNALETLSQRLDSKSLGEALDALSGVNSVPLEPVLKFVTNSPDPELRIRALDVLNEHGAGDPRVITLLRKLAVSDPDEDVRSNARGLLE